MKLKVILGDWSDDGHSEKETICLKVNLTRNLIVQAYRESCEKYNLIFHDDYEDKKNLKILMDDNFNQEAVEILHKIFLAGGIKDNPELYDDEEIEFSRKEKFVILLFKFIKLSLPNLEWEFIEEDIPYLNGYWQDDFNESLGYNLFD